MSCNFFRDSMPPADCSLWRSRGDLHNFVYSILVVFLELDDNRGKLVQLVRLVQVFRLPLLHCLFVRANAKGISLEIENECRDMCRKAMKDIALVSKIFDFKEISGNKIFFDTFEFVAFFSGDIHCDNDFLAIKRLLAGKVSLDLIVAAVVSAVNVRGCHMDESPLISEFLD